MRNMVRNQTFVAQNDQLITITSQSETQSDINGKYYIQDRDARK